MTGGAPRANPDRCRILVCDAEQSAALAAVRSLGRRGHEVAVCSHEAPCIAGVSRWVRGGFLVPTPFGAGDAYANGVKDAAVRWRADIVLPMTDQSNLQLLGARELLAPSIVPGPTLEAFQRVSNKAWLLSLATAQGIAVPSQVLLERRPEPGAMASVAMPVVIKPARSVAGNAHHFVSYANTAADLAGRLGAAPDSAFPILLQQRVVGPGVGVFLLIHDGAVIATFAHRRLREQPPSGGRSVYCESIAAPAELVERSAGLLMACGWEGPAMVEYKRDTASGRHYLMEVNGRFWGSLQLSIDAGVDFPSLFVDAARGRVPSAVATYHVGTRLRSWWNDVAVLLTRLHHSPAALDMAPGQPGRLSALIDFLRWSPHEHFETFRWNDLAPFRLQTRQLLARRFGRRS